MPGWPSIGLVIPGNENWSDKWSNCLTMRMQAHDSIRACWHELRTANAAKPNESPYQHRSIRTGATEPNRW